MGAQQLAGSSQILRCDPLPQAPAHAAAPSLGGVERVEGLHDL
jgi:hypothetical protein